VLVNTLILLFAGLGVGLVISPVLAGFYHMGLLLLIPLWLLAVILGINLLRRLLGGPHGASGWIQRLSNWRDSE
jgi:hypothetical protein